MHTRAEHVSELGPCMPGHCRRTTLPTRRSASSGLTSRVTRSSTTSPRARAPTPPCARFCYAHPHTLIVCHRSWPLLLHVEVSPVRRGVHVWQQPERLPTEMDAKLTCIGCMCVHACMAHVCMATRAGVGHHHRWQVPAERPVPDCALHRAPARGRAVHDPVQRGQRGRHLPVLPRLRHAARCRVSLETPACLSRS